MRVPIKKEGDIYYIDIDMDLAPHGFEDAFDKSVFKHRLDNGTAYGEYKYPAGVFNNYSRFLSIEANNLSHYFKWLGINNGMIRLQVIGIGPFKDHFFDYVNATSRNGQHPAVVFRLNINDDHVENIYTADLNI